MLESEAFENENVSNEQINLMMDEFEKDTILTHEKSLARTGSDRRWTILADKLNAVPGGSEKSVQHWKAITIRWKQSVKEQASDEVDGTEDLSEMCKRMLSLVEEEALQEQLRLKEEALAKRLRRLKRSHPHLWKIIKVDPATTSENQEGARRLSLKMTNRRKARLAKAGLGQGIYVLSQQRKQKSLKTIYDNRVDQENTSERKIVQMQLDRLQDVSQQLESHIQDVQNRIQMIKDIWEHECEDGGDVPA